MVDSKTWLFCGPYNNETQSKESFAYTANVHLEIQITREIAKEQGAFVTISAMSLLGQITAQPDFATIHISYIPDKLCVESQSLKLYLYLTRNHTEFYENCINTKSEDLVNLLETLYLEVWGKFTPRGGISISTPTITTVSKELSMRAWQNNASSNTTFIQRKLTR